MPSKPKGKSTKGSSSDAKPPRPPAEKQQQEEQEREEVFEQGEGVLARDSGELYDAKVMRVSEATAATPRQYFIHYQGWNSKWDKWVDGDALLKVTPENRKLQAQLKELKQAAKKRPAAVDAGEGQEEAVTVASSKGAGGSSKKSGKGGKEEGEMLPPPDPDIVEDSSNGPQVKLSIPFTLKKQLVDDWEKVTRDPSQLVPLPRTSSAAAVLQRFVASKREKDGTSALQLRRYQELTEGLRVYFDRALPLTLLYRQEKEQFERAKKAFGGDNTKDFCPSSIYGPEHLLRLFVRLPHLLAQAPMTAAEATQVQAKLGDLLKFMQRHHQELFLQVYTRVGEDCITLPTSAAAASSSSSSNASAMEEEGQGEQKGVAEKGEGEGETAATMMEVVAN